MVEKKVPEVLVNVVVVVGLVYLGDLRNILCTTVSVLDVALLDDTTDDRTCS